MKQKLSLLGFTLIELLVVISVIGFLSSIVLASFNATRHKARVARAQGDLKQIYNAIALLTDDTGKWPNGCPVDDWEDPEVWIDDTWAGLNAMPPQGLAPSGGGLTRFACEWTASDLAKWRGPYIRYVKDPWGRSYLFDPDFCTDYGRIVPALVSLGPDGLESYMSTACNVVVGPSLPGLVGGPIPGDDIVLYLPGYSR